LPACRQAMYVPITICFSDKLYKGLKQCSGAGWIRIQIARLDPDPDPESEIEL